MSLTQLEPQNADITSTLQELRQLVRRVIFQIGRQPDRYAPEMSDPSRALVQLRKVEFVNQFQRQISNLFINLQLPEIPLDVLICIFEYAEPDAWKGTYTQFLASARAGMEVLKRQVAERQKFDAAWREQERQNSSRAIESEADESEEPEEPDGPEFDAGHGWED